MATTTRLLTTSNPSRQLLPNSNTCFCPPWGTKLKCLAKSELGGHSHKVVSSNSGGYIDNKRKFSRTTIKTATTKNYNMVTLVGRRVLDTENYNMASCLVGTFRSEYLVKVCEYLCKVLCRLRLKPLMSNVQMFIERAIIDCRFFTLFAVVGSLLGSVLCFIEGCVLILEAYLQYFNLLSHSSDQGHDLMHLLIESIDMFLVGTAMLIFGVGLYVMFVDSKTSKEKDLWLPGSNLFGLFHLKVLPTWIDMQSITQAKSKMGHAILMILQVGLLEKFKNIPVVNCFDLACLGAAVFISSACIFILSRLSVGRISWKMER